jgi:hypothetical protein
LDLDVALAVAADLEVELAAVAFEQDLVAADFQHWVAVDLHYPVADLHQAVALGFADLELGFVDLDPYSHYYLHQVHSDFLLG